MLRNVILIVAAPAGMHHAQEATYGAIAIGALALIAIGGFAISSHPHKIPGATASTSTQPCRRPPLADHQSDKDPPPIGGWRGRQADAPG
jgi:hypothetical protein